MKKVLILTGSVRRGNVSDKVAELVRTKLAGKDFAPEIIHVGDLDLPFLDSPVSPSDPGFEFEHDSVRRWSEMVKQADAVVWVMPEYNHAISGVQKNAIDWLYHEWIDKPVAIAAYGWHDGENVLESIRLMIGVLKIDLRAKVGLCFDKQITVDGSVKDETAVDKLLDELADGLAD